MLTLAHNTLLVLLLILLFGLVTPELFRRLKLPWVASLILVGSVLGPHGLNYVASNEAVEAFGFLGFTFLMLMAGLETDVESLKRSRWGLAAMAAANGLIPFLAGFGVTWAFGYGLWASLLVGTVFVSSSVAVVVPTIRSYVFRREGDGPAMATAAVVEDLISLGLLAVVLQTFSPTTALPLPQYFVALIISVLFLRRVLPGLAKRFFASRYAGNSRDETQLRFVIVMLMAVLLFFSFLGVHPIVAAFLAGLFLAQTVTSTEVIGKLHTIGYGLFVPVFFFIVGMEVDLTVLARFDRIGLFVLLLATALVGSKVLGGYLGGRSAGMTGRTSLFFGLVSLPQLTPTLAAAYAAVNLGLIDRTVVSAVILLSVTTSLVTPYLLRASVGRLGVRPVEEGGAAVKSGGGQ